MIDSGLIIEASSLHGNRPPLADSSPETLEQRVLRLEGAVAALQDTRQLEERVVERVAERLNRNPGLGVRDSAGIVIDSARHLLPAAVGMIQPPKDSAYGASSSLPPREPWLLFDVYSEVRTMIRMFVDPRYPMTWSVRIIVLVFVVAIFLSWIWLPGTAILSGIGLSSLATILDKAVDLVLAFFLYKILSREVRRYQAAVSHSSPTHSTT